MTKDAFTKKYRDLLAGMMLNMAVNKRSGADLALEVRTIFDKVDSLLLKMHEDLLPDPPLQAAQPNGALKNERETRNASSATAGKANGPVSQGGK